MAYSPGENLYLKALADLQFPGTTAEDVDAAMADQGELAAEGQMPPGTRPGDVLVAEVGSRGLPEQAYTGRYPDSISPVDPTVRQKMADFLQAGFERFGMDRYRARKQAQTLMGGESSNLPLSLGFADIVPFLGTALQTQEAARMGEEAVQSAKAGETGTAALQAGGAAVGMIPGAAGTVKAAKKIKAAIKENK